MLKRDTVTVQSFYEGHGAKLEMTLMAGRPGLDRVIREATVNRPGLVLAGFTKYFANKRVQVLGNAEMHFLRSLPRDTLLKRLARFFGFRIPCVVLCRGYRVPSELLAAARRAEVPVFKSPLVTMKFINQATLLLENMFAPHDTEIGSMVDILGVGVIIRGESGIGKSECVLALIERGYSLVSDDVTRLTLNEGRIIGASPETTRDHMEVRGIGIINVPAMFGVRSIRRQKRVDLVVSLKPWESVPDVDRVGMEDQTTRLLGIPVPHITIPVRPGRDIARLIEVAAFHAKLRMAGHNPARELNERLIAQMTGKG
ncbi:MAG: HPr(Ser) kinase/phosphatase [Verrucomicrobia bacterium]|nr:HPr(Ser) kinase/phosphatase [Verrucomicrobiota bacterium]